MVNVFARIGPYIDLNPRAHLPKVTLKTLVETEPGPCGERKHIMGEQQGSDENLIKSHILK